METLLVDRDTACKMLSVGLTKFLELNEIDEKFPRPVEVSAFNQKIYYRVDDLKEWVKSLPCRVKAK